MIITIRGMGIIAPTGIGIGEFARNTFRHPPTPARLADLTNGQPVPEGLAHVVKGFDVGQIVGRRKGIRVLDRTSALAVASTHLALQDANYPESERAGVGVVLGTGCGSQQSLYQFIQETYTAEQPHWVSPEMFPRTVMNYAAGQVAIWFGLQALNTTIAGGRLAGLLALRYGARVLRRGYAESVVAGSVQEFSAEGAWIAHHAAAAHGRQLPTLGEGGAMFVLENRAESERRYAEMLACEVATAADSDEGNLVHCLARCIATSLRKASMRSEDIWAVVGRSRDGSQLGPIETQALAIALSGSWPAQVQSIEEALGDTYCASAALQVAALLTVLRGQHAPPNACGLVISFSHNGMAGCAIFRST